MAGFEMAPSNQTDEISALRRRVAELETDVQRQKRAFEERFRRLADAAPVMIWMAGPDARCSYFNRAWLEFRGRTLEEESGNGWTAGLHPDDRDLCVETYIKSFTARQPFRMQYRMERAGGQYSWLEDVGVPRYEEDGEFAGFMGSAIDITDRKRGYFTPDEASVRMVFALTERERQVLVLIADGKSTKEAAAQLGISYKTADSHRSRILEKLGVHETASMVRYAIRAGLIEA
ncbi:Transcriptional regulator, LuxR family [Candidatus Sulfopaludibacter sp. SbA3]|nr:Transcriptional regulator, LuxR family [Candidatus Sulfopaludibacter sp. SbA3]